MLEVKDCTLEDEKVGHFEGTNANASGTNKSTKLPSEGTRTTPAALEINNNVQQPHTPERGETSPKPRSVVELFMRYNKKSGKVNSGSKANPKESKKTSPPKGKQENTVKIGFDKMSSDEKSGFLQKLKMLAVNEPNGNDGKRRNYVEKNGDFSTKGRVNTKFRRNFENDEDKRQGTRSRNDHGKDVHPEERKTDEKRKFVAAMGRQYNKLFTTSSSRSRVNIPKSARDDSRSPIETSSSSPTKHSLSSNSSPSKSSYSTGSHRGRLSTEREYSNVPNDASFWEGELPPRDYNNPTFSRKIFVGGVPWDITENALKESFGEFGQCVVEWPGQEARYRGGGNNGRMRTDSRNTKGQHSHQSATGYVYMIFDNERAVAALLRECSQEMGGAGEWYFKIRAQRSKSTEIRQVQIIPWVTSDSLHCEDDEIMMNGVELKRTVFVGALHGMMTSQVLHSIMEDCFGKVECVQLDTDKFKYPIGSGRVTFNDHNAYFRAIEIGHLFVQTSKFKKRVQIDPFLESTMCMMCNNEVAHRFCRDKTCFKYYCNGCWNTDHGKGTSKAQHKPVFVPSSASKPVSSHSSLGSPRHATLSSSGSSYKSMNSHGSPPATSQLMANVAGVTAVPVIMTTPQAMYGFLPQVNNTHPSVIGVSGSRQPMHSLQQQFQMPYETMTMVPSMTTLVPVSSIESVGVPSGSDQLSNRSLSMTSVSTGPNCSMQMSPMKSIQNGDLGTMANCSTTYYLSTTPGSSPRKGVSTEQLSTASPVYGNNTYASPNYYAQPTAQNINIGASFHGNNLYYGYIPQSATPTKHHPATVIYDYSHGGMCNPSPTPSNSSIQYYCTPQNH